MTCGRRKALSVTEQSVPVKNKQRTFSLAQREQLQTPRPGLGERTFEVPADFGSVDAERIAQLAEDSVAMCLS